MQRRARRVGERHTGGVSLTLISRLNMCSRSGSRDRKPQAGQVPRAVFRPATAHRISHPENLVVSRSSVAIGGMRQDFGDVPIGLSHGGRRSRSDPGFARPRRRCADPGPGPMPVRRTRSSSAVVCDRNAGAPGSAAAVNPSWPGRPRSATVATRSTMPGVDGGAGGAVHTERIADDSLEVERDSSVRCTPIPIGNARLRRSPTDWLPGGCSLRSHTGGTATPVRPSKPRCRCSAPRRSRHRGTRPVPVAAPRESAGVMRIPAQVSCSG